ncbi:MAG: PQQ-binding-like beta-propeller repeat protein [Verrucomicrobiota bacterium]
MIKFGLNTFLIVALSLPWAQAADWPQWRGPTGQGISTATGLPSTWSESDNIKWKTELPGRGYSSPVIAGDQVWMTTAFETPADPDDAKERLKANTGGQPVTVLAKVELHALCVHRSTGKVLHNVKLLEMKKPQWVHELNSYASPTPVYEDGRLYCHFGAYGNACLDTKNTRILWTNQDLHVMHENGPGSTPVLVQDFMIVHYDGSDEQFIVALKKSDGSVAWKVDRSGEMHSNPQLQKAYGTPLVVNDQVISPAANWLYAYDPATGKELWKVEYGLLGFSNVARPVFGHDKIYAVTGFMKSKMLAVELGEKPGIKWSYIKGVPKMASPLLVGDELYFVTDKGGVVTCLDAHTGEELWKERVGGNFSASPTYADGKIFFHSQDGKTIVLAPGRTFKKLAENQLDGRLMASAAPVDGALFLRTDKALYRIEK